VRKGLGERSRFSDWAYRLKDPELGSRQDEVYLFFETSTQAVGPIQDSYSKGTVGSFPEEEKANGFINLLLTSKFI
jgi:hypothetical protein